MDYGNLLKAWVVTKVLFSCCNMEGLTLVGVFMESNVRRKNPGGNLSRESQLNYTTHEHHSKIKLLHTQWSFELIPLQDHHILKIIAHRSARQSNSILLISYRTCCMVDHLQVATTLSFLNLKLHHHPPSPGK